MTLTWQELVQTAVTLEEQGRDFYRHLAERARKTEARHVFTQLAAEEEEHAAFFRRWLPAEGEAVGEDTASYLWALRRPELFVGDEEALGDPYRALAVAIEAEKEAILCHTELGRARPRRAGARTSCPVAQGGEIAPHRTPGSPGGGLVTCAADKPRPAKASRTGAASTAGNEKRRFTETP